MKFGKGVSGGSTQQCHECAHTTKINTSKHDASHLPLEYKIDSIEAMRQSFLHTFCKKPLTGNCIMKSKLIVED